MASEMVKSTKFMEFLERTKPATFEEELRRNSLIENFRKLDESESRYMRKEWNRPLRINMQSGNKYTNVIVVSLDEKTGQATCVSNLHSAAPSTSSFNVIYVETIDSLGEQD